MIIPSASEATVPMEGSLVVCIGRISTVAASLVSRCETTIDYPIRRAVPPTLFQVLIDVYEVVVIGIFNRISNLSEFVCFSTVSVHIVIIEKVCGIVMRSTRGADFGL